MSGGYGGDIVERITEGFASWPDRKPVGVSKDGRPIYSPFHSGG